MSTGKSAELGLDCPTQTLVHDKGGYKLRCRTLRIEIAAGPNAGRCVELAGPEVRVGSGRGCDLVLDDPTVSHQHLSLLVEEHGVRVRDAGSRNGTVLDGIRVIDAYASARSRLVLGATTIVLDQSEATVDVPVSSRDRFGRMLGSSIAMRRVFAILERVAPTDTTVLIEGETGTGKELVAEALHEASNRAGGPFVVFDCSAVSGSLIESELFGHVKGSFTGAIHDREGAFEAADGGTLFLDEVGELPLDLQPKLLRALESREVRRIGSHRPVRVNVRIVAATNRELSVEVDRNRFREDLYYRLAVVRVLLPPLRERRDDIALLAEHFAPGALHARTIETLKNQPWPGNVRELRNAVERAISLGTPIDSQPAVPPAARPLRVDLSVPLKQARDDIADEFERAYLIEALRAANGNITRAAAIAKVHRKFVHRAIQRHRLDDRDR